jgi:hypothetical protein
MTPAVRAFVEMLLDRIAQLEHGQKTPRIPRCRPARNIRTPGRSRRNENPRRNVAGSPAMRNTNDR